jgi:peptidyl-prolyl cis-trans isomerase-like protein 2
MGKKRHSKDRMFITMSEHKEDWGGKKDAIKAPIAKLPFNSCSLSLLPFENPVCTKDGIIFDIVYSHFNILSSPSSNIVPYLKKYKKNPVNGEPLKISDLIKLNFYKNDKGIANSSL